MATHEEIKAAGGNDVGDWGEKQLASYEGGPLVIDGEPVDVSKLPKFGDGEPDPPAAEMGDLGSTGDTGNAGDIYEGESPRAPLRP